MLQTGWNCLARQEKEPDIIKSTNFGKHVKGLKKKKKNPTQMKSTKTNTKEKDSSFKYRSVAPLLADVNLQVMVQSIIPIGTATSDHPNYKS